MKAHYIGGSTVDVFPSLHRPWSSACSNVTYIVSVIFRQLHGHHNLPAKHLSDTRKINQSLEVKSNVFLYSGHVYIVSLKQLCRLVHKRGHTESFCTVVDCGLRFHSFHHRHTEYVEYVET